jgi:chaperonin GroEL
MKNVIAGANPMDLKRGIDKAVLRLFPPQSQSKQVGNDMEKIERWPPSQPQNDNEIGKLIARLWAR